MGESYCNSQGSIVGVGSLDSTEKVQKAGEDTQRLVNKALLRPNRISSLRGSEFVYWRAADK